MFQPISGRKSNLGVLFFVATTLGFSVVTLARKKITERGEKDVVVLSSSCVDAKKMAPIVNIQESYAAKASETIDDSTRKIETFEPNSPPMNALLENERVKQAVSPQCVHRAANAPSLNNAQYHETQGTGGQVSISEDIETLPRSGNSTPTAFKGHLTHTDLLVSTQHDSTPIALSAYSDEILPNRECETPVSMFIESGDSESVVSSYYFPVILTEQSKERALYRRTKTNPNVNRKLVIDDNISNVDETSTDFDGTLGSWTLDGTLDSEQIQDSNDENDEFAMMNDSLQSISPPEPWAPPMTIRVEAGAFLPTGESFFHVVSSTRLSSVVWTVKKTYVHFEQLRFAVEKHIQDLAADFPLPPSPPSLLVAPSSSEAKPSKAKRRDKKSKAHKAGGQVEECPPQVQETREKLDTFMRELCGRRDITSRPKVFDLIVNFVDPNPGNS